MKIPVACVQCGTEYPSDAIPYRCPQCGGIYDWVGVFAYHSQRHEQAAATLWQYQKSFNLPTRIHPITLGEGRTPLIADTFGDQKIFYKLEYLNPTGSYKDRASSVLVSFLHSRGVTSAIEDSSGNAGASFAAYAARAGMHARVFIPESASGPKRRQIEAYGAELVTISGPRSAAAEAVACEAEAGAVYASHAFLPFGMAGIATIAYEVFEQLGRVPGTVIAPAGHASLVLGILRGFKALQAAGMIDKIPTMVVVQSAGCAPIWAAYHEKSLPVTESLTLAEGVSVLHPVRAPALLNELVRGRDLVLAFDDNQIMISRSELSRRGFDVEPTSALVWCALTKSDQKLPKPIVLVLTGSGLKYERNQQHI